MPDLPGTNVPAVSPPDEDVPLPTAEVVSLDERREPDPVDFDTLPADTQVSVTIGVLRDLIDTNKAMDTALDDALEDLHAITDALGIHTDLPISPRDMVVNHVLPRIARLMAQDGMVKAAEAQISEVVAGAKARGETPVLGANGMAMIKVGQRLTGAQLADTQRSEALKHRDRRRGKHQ